MCPSLLLLLLLLGTRHCDSPDRCDSYNRRDLGRQGRQREGGGGVVVIRQREGCGHWETGREAAAAAVRGLAAASCAGLCIVSWRR